MTISRNLGAKKKYACQLKKSQKNAYQEVEDGNEEDEKKDPNNTSQIMWTSVPYCIKFESSLGYKAKLNCATPYLLA